MNASKWDERRERAQELALQYPFAAEILGFHARVFELQKSLYAQADEWRSHHQPFRAAASCELAASIRPLVPRFRQFLAQLQSFAPLPIAQAASELRSSVNGTCEQLLTRECRDDLWPAESASEGLLVVLFLQPYLENLAAHCDRAAANRTANLCPFCSGKPVVGALRREGDGAKRSLICSRCATEWAYGRILCACCGEAAVDKLAVYRASQFEHVRIESCDSCRRYLKTVDLTSNGRAVPIVDELATIPLNLWAEEHGYSKIQTNVMGI